MIETIFTKEGISVQVNTLDEVWYQIVNELTGKTRTYYMYSPHREARRIG